MLLVREMPRTTDNILEMDDKKLWRIVLHHVDAAMSRLNLTGLKTFSLDETKSQKGHRDVTVFIDLDRKERPVVFATYGKGKATLKAFKDHLVARGGKAEHVVEVVSDMSGSFIAGVKAHFANSSLTVDWFHVVQLFTRAVEEVRRAESKEVAMPKASAGQRSRRPRAISPRPNSMRWQNWWPWTSTPPRPGELRNGSVGCAGRPPRGRRNGG